MTGKTLLSALVAMKGDEENVEESTRSECVDSKLYQKKNALANERCAPGSYDPSPFDHG